MKTSRERMHSETGRACEHVALGDARYPENLREITTPPERLYVRGRFAEDDALAVAIVGSRAATSYGLAVAERLAADLAARGVTVVSGLARGIDSAAHRGALRAGGRTIAVLGSGVDVIYPPENRRLAGEIESHGAVVSQFEPGTRPLSGHFPARNRVIAGLALAVVVVEAAEKSGSLITAGFAGEMGREVMAVPGLLTSAQSVGAHRLIQDGAALIQGWEDVVSQLPLRWRDRITSTSMKITAMRPAPARPDTFEAGHLAHHQSEHSQLLGLIGEEPTDIDGIIERSGMTPGRASALLVTLEVEGRIRQLEGKRFVQVSLG
ncbi:MAG TPA: DNA-processing protein DprA [Candidatus Acidoferrales bacterium]|nr:DNA-processing protein DprA [Candidatus Acidoferrales bacterium]